MSKGRQVPFAYQRKEQFPAKLVEWIGEVFYDILPEHGYEVREEQVYTAFQLADAVCDHKVHLAEAGLGTGKTFAYLLTAVAYARFSGKPVVIACASTALQEQLAGPGGDIETLSTLLGLEIDARMAKDPRQYICDVRADELCNSFAEHTSEVSSQLSRWLEQTKSGERSEIPLVPDRIWKQIGWDESMSCETCSCRGFCKLIKAREHYRQAGDLIIADHDVFFADLWTRAERIADDRWPFLSSYSAVIFDEGHKVILPAAMQAGGHIDKEEIASITFVVEQIQEARDSLIDKAVELEDACFGFFAVLQDCTVNDETSQRLALQVNDELLQAAGNFRTALELLHDEFQVEQGLYLESLPTSQVQAFEQQLEQAMLTLKRFGANENSDVITWVDRKDGTFWVVPRNLSQLLAKHLFNKEIPVVFTSATLSNEGDFSYFTRSLGLEKPSSSTVGSAFDLEEQVVVYLPKDKEDNSDTRKIQQLASLLKQNKGSALVLTSSLAEVRRIRKELAGYQLPFEVLWEDKGERGYLVRKFREDVDSVLVGANFWEGIDVPGESLTLVVVWQLPFPALDPLIEVRRKEAVAAGLDPTLAVDYPEMGLKLKQGCGRLIRKEDDRGAIAIMESVTGKPWEKFVLGALPPGAKIKALQ